MSRDAKSPVSKLAREKWQRSGLTDKDAKRLGLTALSGAEVTKLEKHFAFAGGLRIPYFDPSGKRTKFYRLRYLEPLPGFAGLAEQRAHADRLKQLITQKNVRINTKYVTPFVIPDCANYLFTSNNNDAFFLDDGDRRFFVHEVVGGPRPMEFYDRIARWRDEGGLRHLLHHFLSLDLKGFDPRAPALMTAAKAAMVFESKGDIARWVADLKSAPAEALSKLGREIAQGCDLFTTSQLMEICPLPSNARPPSESAFGRALKRAGLRQVFGGQTVRTSRGSSRLYAVRNTERWARAAPRECAEHWDSFFKLPAELSDESPSRRY